MVSRTNIEPLAAQKNGIMTLNLEARRIKALGILAHTMKALGIMTLIDKTALSITVFWMMELGIMTLIMMMLDGKLGHLQLIFSVFNAVKDVNEADNEGKT